MIGAFFSMGFAIYGIPYFSKMPFSLTIICNSFLIGLSVSSCSQFYLEMKNRSFLKQKLESNIQKVLENEQHRYLHALNKLEILNPLLTIKRGYSITRNQDHVVTSIQQVKPHDKLKIEVTDGLIEARVEEVKS